MKHKHAELIHAWADGAQIQYRAVPGEGEWCDEPRHLIWEEYAEYRIKPEPKPDFVDYAKVFTGYNGLVIGFSQRPGEYNVRFTFDGETGKLKSAEVL